MYCKHCGKENKDGQNFCKYCGTRLSASEEAEQVFEEDRDIETETWHDGEVERQTVKPAYKTKAASPKRKKGIKLDKRILIGMIVSLSVVLFVAGLSLGLFFTMGSFNPISLFELNKDVETMATDNEADDKTDKDDVDSHEVSDTIAVINTTENNTETEEPADADMFARFLAGNAKAVIADDYLSTTDADKMEPGKEYTVSGIIEHINEYNKDNGGQSIDPNVYYAKLNIHDETLYALKLLFTEYVGNEYMDCNNHTFVIREKNHRLEIKFAVWELYSGTIGTPINDLVSSEGIAKHGVYGDSGDIWEMVWAPDENFTYKEVYKIQSNAAGTAGYYDYDDPNANSSDPMEPLHTIAREASMGNESAGKVIYYKETINGDIFYYYLGDKDNPIKQDTVDYIDAIASEYGFGFDGKAAADDAREAYENELGVYEACQDQTKADWIVVE